MDKRFLAILSAIIIIFVGIAVFRNNNTNNQSTSGPVQASNHVRGSNSKNVRLTEYGDFQCSVCELYEPVIKQVVDNNLDKIQFQFRHLPLVGPHKNAFAAARAAEAASIQNKFWEMHDLLYDSNNWQNWTESNNSRALFENYAGQLGLDMTQFKQDYASAKVNNIINADLDAFKKTGQSMATPTFFLNGNHLANPSLTDESGRPSVAKIQALLDAEFAKPR